MGKIIVIDGLDGSGKGTQTKLLYEWLIKHKLNAHMISFPAYSSPSSAPVKMYLNGELGKDATELNPYMCSTFYAVDRAIQYIKDFKSLLEQENSIIITDRYISSNIIHQGGKIKDIEKRKNFFKWAYEFETQLMQIPKENLTIFLEVPVWKSQELLLERYKGDVQKRDIHESNIEYLQMCYDSATSALQTLNDLGHNWKKISCLDMNNNLKTKDEIFQEILNTIRPLI